MSYLDRNEILILRVLLNIRLCINCPSTKNLCINKCDMVMRRKSLTGAKNWYQRCIKLSAMEKMHGLVMTLFILMDVPYVASTRTLRRLI